MVLTNLSIQKRAFPSNLNSQRLDLSDLSADWPVAQFRTDGEAFEKLRIGLHYLAFSPSSIDECLEARDLQILTTYREKHLDEAAIEDY
jgi:hypothetical protein